MRWKQIPSELTDKVQYISEQGHITKVGTTPEDERFLKHSLKANGYYSVSLRKDFRYLPRTVHSLVMAAFKGPRPDGLEIDHIDGDKLNNELSNLEYVSSEENKQRARSLGLAKQTKTESHYFGVGWHKTAERWRASFRHNGKQIYLGMFDSDLLAAKAVNEYIEANDNYRELNILTPELEKFGKERIYEKHK